VAAFEAAVARAERAPPGEEVAALGEAAGLYGGDLLHGAYDDWVLEERERLRQRHLQVLERLVELLAARGDHAAAIRHAERLLRDDPLREATWQVLMGLHDARGDRARALRTYHACAATLERELGVEPSPATRRAYEALLPAPPRPAAAAPTEPLGPVGAPPLVGRAAQRARLADLWRASQRGAARLALVTGEPGAGKTRLVEELRSWCAQQGAATAEARSYPAEGALAYGPVASWLRSPALAGHLGRLDPPRLAELARLLPELRASAPDPAADLPARDRRRLLFEALAQAVAAPGGPLLLVADDLHWADAETVAFLHYLLRARPQAPLLVAATARDEDLGDEHPLRALRAGLAALGQLAEVEVGRLSERETAALAGRLAGRELAAADAGRLFAETEGNPLFVVEALRAGWPPPRPGEPGPITPRVQSVIESRLAQLSAPARDLIGVAATIGREFSTDVLVQASQAGEEQLVGALDELWRRRVVRDQGPDAYDFTHDRIREVAYRSLSPARRRQTHRRVAQALERLNAGDLAPVAAQLAAHHERAGDREEAVAWYRRGAGVAQRLGANAEAVRLLDRALRLHRRLPPTPARRERELELVTRLQAPLGVAEGYASERLAEVQRQGLELADRLGVEPGAPLLLSMALASLSRGDFEDAQRLGEQLVAGDGDDAVRRVEGEYLLGIAGFWRGEFGTARRHFEAAVDRYRADQRPAHLLRFGIDLEVVCTSRLANTLWFLGRPGDAVQARDAAVALAERLGHPHSHATALVFAALLALDLRDQASVRAYAAALAARPADQEPPTRVPSGALAGYVEVLDGRAAGLARIRRALDDPAEGEHAPGMHASIARVLLEACLAAGDARAGLDAADRVLAAEDNVRTWAAEARRLRGEFLAALGAPTGQVEAELERAAATARRQGAGSLELRATASLLRHHLDRDPGGEGGRPGPARDALAALVAAVPEGHDTPDLREALALLARA